MSAWQPPRRYGSVNVVSALLYVGIPLPSDRSGNTGPPPCGEYQIVLSRAGGRFTRPVLRGELFCRLSQSYQPVRMLASSLLRSRYGWPLPMQYGHPWLPADEMMVAVSYFAGPSSGLGLPASGPTQAACSRSVVGSTKSVEMLRTPIT